VHLLNNLKWKISRLDCCCFEVMNNFINVFTETAFFLTDSGKYNTIKDNNTMLTLSTT